MLASAYDTIVQALLNLEPREIILSSGEVIIEKLVEVEPSEAAIRKLIAENIKDFIPKQAPPPQPIIQTREEIRYVKTEDNLGRAYQLLYGQKNYYEAMKILKDLDSKNDAEAQAILGIMHLEGLGVTKDLNKAIQFFLKAMKGGNTEATYRLAILLEVLIKELF